MSDWLEPLWNLFSPKGALQEQLSDGNPSTPTYSAFGRNAKTFKYQTKFPQTDKPPVVNTYQPVQDLGLTQIQIDAMLSSQLQTADPRVQNNTSASYDLQNMNVQPTSPTNSSQSGFIVAIGLFFVALIILSLFRKKRG